MLFSVLSFVHSYESLESQHGDSGATALEPWKEMQILRDYMEEKGVHSLGLCRLGRRELVYLDCCGC
jgi:hypothetical protein